MWTRAESNRVFRSAKPMCFRYHYGPIMLERKEGFEPSTFSLATKYSTPELLPRFLERESMTEH